MGRPAHGFSLSTRRPAGRCSLMPEGTAQQQLGPVGSTVHRARASAMGAVTTVGNGAVARVATAHRRLACCGFGDSSYRNLSRFELKFELKFKKVSMS
jgi:hypothetical protein